METKKLIKEIERLNKIVGKDIPLSKEIVDEINLGFLHARLSEQLRERNRIMDLIIYGDSYDIFDLDDAILREPLLNKINTPFKPKTK